MVTVVMTTDTFYFTLSMNVPQGMSENILMETVLLSIVRKS